MTSDAGVLLLVAIDRVIGLVQRFAACFRDTRDQDAIEHTVETLVTQRAPLAGKSMLNRLELSKPEPMRYQC